MSVMPYAGTPTPAFEESNRHEWIDAGEDNMWFLYLESLMLGSGMHNAIVKGVADMIYGHGLDATYKDQHIDQWLRVKVLFGDETCWKRAAFDLKLYGQCYLNVIWSQDRTTISEVHHVPCANVRCGKVNDDDEVTHFYYSTDWEHVSQNPPQVIPAFSSNDRTAASQMLQIKLYNPQSFYYGLPDYIGSLSWIDADAKVADFHSSSLENGLFPSMVINFRSGVPSDEERQKLERLIYDKFGSASNAGKFLITYSDSADEAPTFEAFQPSDPQKTYAFYSEQIVTQVLSGHRVTSPLLFGLRNEGGGFGSNADEMRDAYELFHNLVVRPFQESFIRQLRPMLSAMGITLDLHFSKLQPASFLYVEEMNLDDAAVDKDASYNGAQIASAVEVLVKVQEGILTEDQAKVFLVQMLQFSPQVADALFVEGVSAIGVVEEEEAQETAVEEVDEAEVQLSRQGRISEEQGEAWLNSLSDKNAAVDQDRFFFLKEESVTDTMVDHRLHNKRNFALDDYANPTEWSDWGEIVSPKGYLYAVRYAYEKTSRDTPEGPSRDFCVEMMELSDAGVEYRYEDIVAMSEAGENGQFAQAGSDGTYPIFEWAGGINCQHGWKRRIYIYEQGEYTFEDLDEALEEWNTLVADRFDSVMDAVGNNPYIVQQGEEAVAPRDKQ